MVKYLICCLLLIALQSGCNKNNTATVSANDDLHELKARSELGENIEYFLSSDTKYILWKSKEAKSSDPNSNKILKYIVISMENGNIVHSDSFVGGSVVWSGTNELEVTYLTAMSIGPSNPTNVHKYIYNIVDKKRRDISSEKR